MSSVFILNNAKDKHTITWPTFQNVRGSDTCYKLLEFLFENLRLDYVQLLLTSDKMVTINAEIWFTNDSGPRRYSEWLMSQYDVIGVVFDNKEKAIELQTELDKRYMWKLLKS